MKKVLIKSLSLILVIVMMLSIFPTSALAVSLPAASPTEFTVMSVKGVPQKIVTVQVRISENSQITSAKWELEFDSSKLLFDSFETGAILSNGMTVANANVSDKVIVTFASLDPVVCEGNLFNVSFKVIGDVLNEKIDVKLNTTELTNIDGKSIVPTVKDGFVEVVDVLYGDINLDNIVSATDALKILSAASEDIILTANEAKSADVNGDGRVSVIDSLQVLYFSAEMSNELYTTAENQIDFFIYNLQAPSNVKISQLGEYDFTISWDGMQDVIGYNVYFDGVKVNQELLTKNSVVIGGDNGDKSIAPKIHNSINHNTDYKIEVTAVNSLKESAKSNIVDIKTKRAYSYVTFKNWDGTVIGVPQKVLYGQDTVKPNDPVRTGYDFIGWDTSTTNVTEDLVVTALYEIQRYNYVFMDWDNTALYTQNIVFGGTATPPADPKRTGYNFNGWYTEKVGGTKVTEFSNASSDKTFYAQYTINTYDITFNSNGGTPIESKRADYASMITAPLNPTKYSYTFAGWYKDENLTNAWNFEKDVITQNTTFYAKWVPIIITIDQAKLSFTATGQSRQLNVAFSSGSDTIKWISDNTNIATVDANTGLVTAKGHGTANIYIEGANSKRTAVCVVTVVAEKKGYVIVNNLAVRSGPATSYPKVCGNINSGNEVTIYGDAQYPGSSGQSGWYYIKTGDGVYGWSSMGNSRNGVYITTTPIAQMPVDADLNEKFAYLKIKFPHDTYWNHGKGTPNNPDGVTLERCTHHSKIKKVCGPHVNTGACGCNSFNGASQCMGFAYKIGYELFKNDPQKNNVRKWKRFRNYDLLRPGDYMRWGEHSAIILTVNANEVTVVECNSDSHPCIIKWGSRKIPRNKIVTKQGYFFSTAR